jgi:hypothetical protein
MTGCVSKKTINPNSQTHRWARELLDDELKGQKKRKYLSRSQHTQQFKNCQLKEVVQRMTI